MMTIQKASKLREQAITLLLIERDQISEQLERLGFMEEKAAALKNRDKPIQHYQLYGRHNRNLPSAS